MSEPVDTEARDLLVEQIAHVRSLALALDHLADTAPASPRLFLRRAVAALTDARAYMENAAEYMLTKGENTP